MATLTLYRLTKDGYEAQTVTQHGNTELAEVAAEEVAGEMGLELEWAETETGSQGSDPSDEEWLWEVEADED